MLFMNWKAQSKLQRKGWALDSKYFNDEGRAAFREADAKPWNALLGTVAIEVSLPKEASNVPTERILSRTMRKVITNKNKEENGKLETKTRLVTPGDVDPDGEIPVEDGGVRIGAPTCPQLAFHIRCAFTVRRRRRMGTFDFQAAFLTGKHHDRYIYVRPPNDGLPGVPHGSLLKRVKGAYGSREAPRLWYLRAKDVLLESGLEEMQTARACFVLRHPTTTRDARHA